MFFSRPLNLHGHEERLGGMKKCDPMGLRHSRQCVCHQGVVTVNFHHLLVVAIVQVDKSIVHREVGVVAHFEAR